MEIQQPISDFEREFRAELQAFIDVVNRASDEAHSSEERVQGFIVSYSPLANTGQIETTQSVQEEAEIQRDMEENTHTEEPRIIPQDEFVFRVPLPSALLNANIIEVETEANISPNIETGLLNPHIRHYGTNAINSPHMMVDGTLIWMKYGKIHRDRDLPAIITPTGNRYWVKHGLQHRERDLPAVIMYNDSLFIWMKEGRVHRDNGKPAIECPMFKRWFINGVLHREIGPAVIGKDGYEWFQHGKLHSIGDSPAIIRVEGQMEWYKNGLLHRDNGPAVIDGIRMEWYKNGKRHRDDGPAVIDQDGVFQFWENGMQVINTIEGEDTKANVGELTCCVCFSNKPAVVSRKCGHVCLCISCSDIISERDQKCPMCRGELDDLFRVYV